MLVVVLILENDDCGRYLLIEVIRITTMGLAMFELVVKDFAISVFYHHYGYILDIL